MPKDSEPSDLGFDLDDDAWLQQARSALTPDSWDNLGEYEILQEISRGGQGVVLQARTSDGQVVAIKRLLAGTLTGTRGRLRFEREMEIAARLNHPCIVPLLRRDIVERQPLLVMPWIDGLPPNLWAHPSAGPAPNQREILQLFLGICDAIAHAHQRGVIHRDLKPSNILVDSNGQPHVLDFGIGKLLLEDAEGTQEITRTSEFVGSPTYAPPERLLGTSEPSDVRDDVYSLGVLLYGLLCENEPYPFGDTLASAIRALQENDPTPIRKHRPNLDRDLAVVVHKAIAKDPSQRYPSVEAFATDLKRFLRGEAVLAHPPSRMYRTRKYVQRYPIPVALSMLSLTFLIGFGSFAFYAQGQATAEAARTHDALSFLTKEVLAQLDPQLRGRVASVPEILRDASADIRSRFGDHPDLEIEIRMAIGRLQLLNGDFSGAAEQLERASDLIPLATSLGAAPSQETQGELALLCAEIHMMQADSAAVAENLATASLWIDAHSKPKDRHHLARLRIREAVLDDNPAKAETLCLAHLESLSLPQDRVESWQSRLLLASLLRTNGKAEEAATLAGQLVLEARALHPNENHIDLADASREWGWSLFHAGSLSAAEAPIHEALGMRRDLLGSMHPDVAESLMDVATWSRFFGKDAQGITAMYEEAVQILRHAGAERHRLVASAWNGLASIAIDKGEFELAGALYQEAYELLKGALGNNHRLLAELHIHRGQMQSLQGNFDKARQAFLLAESILKPEKEERLEHPSLYMEMALNEANAQQPLQAITYYQNAIDSLLLLNLNASHPLANCYAWMAEQQEKLGEDLPAAASRTESAKWRDAAKLKLRHGD